MAKAITEHNAKLAAARKELAQRQHALAELDRRAAASEAAAIADRKAMADAALRVARRQDQAAQAELDRLSAESTKQAMLREAYAAARTDCLRDIELAQGHIALLEDVVQAEANVAAIPEAEAAARLFDESCAQLAAVVSALGASGTGLGGNDIHEAIERSGLGNALRNVGVPIPRVDLPATDVFTPDPNGRGRIKERVIADPRSAAALVAAGAVHHREQRLAEARRMLAAFEANPTLPVRTLRDIDKPPVRSATPPAVVAEQPKMQQVIPPPPRVSTGT